MIERIDSYKTDDNQRLELTFESLEDNVDGIPTKVIGMPYLRDPRNNTLYRTAFTDVALQDHSEKVGGVVAGVVPPAHMQNERFDRFCPSVKFEYSSMEYYSIPGLATNYSHDGFLVPVYFGLEALNKYTQNPKYTISILSGTYGSICQDGEWQISFGINSKKQVLMWLGDIDDLPIKEQRYLLSENIPSSFDLHSDFYDAQIDNQWSEGAIENKCLSLREAISDKTKGLHGDDLYKLPDEIGLTIAGLQKPIFWEQRHITTVIESLNRIFIESINESFLKSFLKSRQLEVPAGMRGLKLMEKFIESLSDPSAARAIMSPLFVLYDYRINVCHLQSMATVATKIQSINERLAIDKSNASHETIYDKLFEKIFDSLTEIKRLVEIAIK